MLAKSLFFLILWMVMTAFAAAKIEKSRVVDTKKSCSTVLSASYIRKLTNVLEAAKSRTNDDVVREYSSGVGTTFYYDAHGKLQTEEQRLHTVESAVGEIEASPAVVSTQVFGGSPPSSINTKFVKNSEFIFSLKEIGGDYQRLEVSSNLGGFAYTVLEGEGLTQIAANNNGVYVYANQMQSSQVLQVGLPKQLPHTTSLYVKTFDVTQAFRTDRYSPIIVGFDKFLILGGSHLGFLNTNTGSYVKLTLPEDSTDGRIIQILVEDQGQTLKILRTVRDADLQENRIIQTILDLNRLK